MLLRLATRVLGSRARAEEAVQDSWLAAWSSIGRFEGRSAIGTWLTVMVRNRALTCATREARMVPHAGAHPIDADTRDPAFQVADPIDPERVLAGRELWTIAAGAIARMPPRQRAVISMSDIHGLDPDQVCPRLRISPGNQRVLLHRARTRVRTALAACA